MSTSHMKLAVRAAFALLATTWAFPQQVGVVHLPLPDSTVFAEDQKMVQLPPGCAHPTGFMADGAVKPPANQPRAISLEIIKLSSQTLEVGSDGRAEVRLKNVGEKAIVIPWSTDSGVIQKAPNPDVLHWEQANLGIVLLEKNRTIALKTADWPLYGSKFVVRSQMTIKPGQWVTAFVNFKVEDLYHFVSATEFPVGDSELFLEWNQVSRTWRREKCGWSRVWLDYGSGGYYKQEHPKVTIKVVGSASGGGENTK